MLDSDGQFEYKEQELQDLLQMNERFSARYFALLERFSDLPACDDLIMAQLKKEFPADFLERLETYEDKFPAGFIDDSEEADLSEPEVDPWSEKQPEELSPAMLLLRQLDMRSREIANSLYQGIFEWCSIQAILLPDALRADALRMLFLQSRAMGSFNASMEALSIHELHSTTVLCKQAQESVNQSIDLITKLIANAPASLKNFLVNRIKQLKKVISDLDTQIQDCRELARLEDHF